MDFHNNLNKLLHASNPNLNQTYIPSINPNFSTLAENNFLNFSDFKAIINEYDMAFEKELLRENTGGGGGRDVGNFKDQEESVGGGAINRQSSNSNLGSNVNCSHINNYFSNSEQNSLIYSKTMKIPILQIPNSVSENFAVSRSTRRADPHRSFSTNSNRFSNMGSNSVDGKNAFAFKNGLTGMKEGSNADCNMSILDAENSYVFDEPIRFAPEISPRERMKELASQLGEYCLTVDLGCLLIQKRKNQLDQVAKMAVFQGKLNSIFYFIFFLKKKND